MEDTDLARSLLEKEKWNLVIVKDRRVLISSRERGVAPFFHAVQSKRDSLEDAAVADRIVGLAIAMLCLHARVGSVYAEVASRGALDTLKKSGVTADSGDTVPYISSRDGTDLCPFEKLAGGCRRPSQFFEALQSLLAEGDR